jgi:HlyD family secretion protein
MEGNLEAVKQKQDNLTIKAPVPGQVTSLNAELGQTKTPGQRLGQIDSFNGFKASAFIDERYIGRIDVDKTGSFDIDNHPFEIVVKKVYPEVKDNKFEVELEFRGERPKAIKRGQTLHISLDLGEISKVVILPRGEFLAVTEGQWIYRVDLAAREAVRTAIKLGRQNAVACEVLRGLKLGDRVITSSYASFGGKDKLVLKER